MVSSVVHNTACTPRFAALQHLGTSHNNTWTLDDLHVLLQLAAALQIVNIALDEHVVQTEEIVEGDAIGLLELLLVSSLQACGSAAQGNHDSLDLQAMVCTCCQR